MATLKEHQAVLLELLKEFDRICCKHNIKYILFAGSALGAVRHQGFIPWDDDVDVALLREEYEKLMRIDVSEWDGAYYLQREFSEHWPLCFSKLRKNNTTCLERYHPKDNRTHQGIYIDIFPIDNISDHLLFRKIQFVASKVVLGKALYKRGYETRSLPKKIFIALCRLLPTKPFCRIARRSWDVNSEMVHSFFGGTSSLKKGVYPREWFTQIMITDFEGENFPISAHSDELLTTMYGNYRELPSEEKRRNKKHALLVDTKFNYSEYDGYRDNIKFDVMTRSIR